jgi:hypothetical protein
VTDVIDPRYVSEHNPEGIPRSWGVSIAWISSLYHPGGTSLEPTIGYDGSIQVASDPEDDLPPPGGDPSWRAARDIWEHRQWRAWLKEHFVREDIFLCLTVEDAGTFKRKLTSSYSRKRGTHNFYGRIAVEQFLTGDERAVVRLASCELFAYAADKLGLPPPPPALLVPCS